MKYGLPYQGSKNKIAEDIIEQLPAADCLVDLFAGGCAISHCALMSGKWKEVIANDILGTPLFFQDCLHGNVPEPRWVTREEFNRDKSSDMYTRLCFSFGADGSSYIYSHARQEFKYAMHRAIVDHSYAEMDSFGIDLREIDESNDLRRRYSIAKKIIKNLKSREELSSFESWFRLQSLENCFDMQNLETLSLSLSLSLDYREVKIPEGAVVYCDPPYKNTKKYANKGFDYEAFYDWACSLSNPVFISEYSMPEDRFECIWQKEKFSLMDAKSNSKKRIEKLWIPKKG